MTRPAPSSPDAFGALNIAAEAYHGKSYFFSDRFSIDGNASVRFLVVVNAYSAQINIWI